MRQVDPGRGDCASFGAGFGQQWRGMKRQEAGAQVSDRIREVAERANVPETFVRQLVAAGALPSEEGELELAGAARRVRLLRSWTAAGLSVETILTLVNRGALSLAFLDALVMALPDRLDCSYEKLATDHG
jgi:hypothetical protein